MSAYSVPIFVPISVGVSYSGFYLVPADDLVRLPILIGQMFQDLADGCGTGNGQAIHSVPNNRLN